MNRIDARVKTTDLCHIRFSLDERRSLQELLRDGRLRNRRLCVDYLREGKLVRGNRAFIFEMCEKMIPDHSAHVRWGACSILGEYAECHPTQLWPLVLIWGSVPSRDIRDGIACCILEHIFQYHFAEFFPKAVRHASKQPRFTYTIQECHKFGQASEPTNSGLFEDFVASYNKRHKPQRARRPANPIAGSSSRHRRTGR